MRALWSSVQHSHGMVALPVSHSHGRVALPPCRKCSLLDVSNPGSGVLIGLQDRVSLQGHVVASPTLAWDVL